jgi:hypothetical protein
LGCAYSFGLKSAVPSESDPSEASVLAAIGGRQEASLMDSHKRSGRMR